MMKLELRRPHLLLACVALLVVAGSALLFQDLVLAQRVDRLEQLREVYHTQQQREHQLYALNQQVHQLRQHEQDLHQQIPDRLQVGSFMEYLGTHLAEQRARKIHVLRDDVHHAPPLQYTTVQVQFHSSFQTAWQTLQAIEDYGQGIRVTRAQVDRDPREPDGELSVQLDLLAIAHSNRTATEDDA